MKDIKSIAALNGAAFFLMFGVGMIVAILPRKMLALSDSAAQVGAMAAAFAIPFILFQLPIGRLSDRYGCKWFLVGGYMVCAAAGLIFYASNSSYAVLAGRMIQGIGEAPVWALAPALLSIRYRQRKALVMGWYNAAIHLGLMSGSLSGVLLSRFWHGSEAFLLFSIMSALGGLGIGVWVDSSNPAKTSLGTMRKYDDLGALLKNRILLLVFLGILLYGIGYGLFLTIIPAFLIQAKQASPDTVGYFFTLFYIAISGAQIIVGPIADRFGRMIPMVGGILTAAVGMFGFPHLPLPAALFILTFAGGGLGVFLVASLAFINDQVSVQFKGTVSGAFYLFWGFGFFAGPLLMGVAGDMNRYSEGFFVMGLLYGLLAAMLLPRARIPVKTSNDT